MSTMERIEILEAAAPNSWLALSGDETKVVGHGSSYEEAVKMAEEAGETDPILIKTPDEWVPMVL
jgi:predicted RNase H-like HicB family nuclease